MPPKDPQPYLTTTPWNKYSMREFPRDQDLPLCPSPACRRAKACIAAHDNIYCRRTHLSVVEMRLKKGLAAHAEKRPEKRWNLRDARARALMYELQASEIEKNNGNLTDRWKAGEFDHLYGKYSPRGVLKIPPKKQYVEKRRRPPK